MDAAPKRLRLIRARVQWYVWILPLTDAKMSWRQRWSRHKTKNAAIVHAMQHILNYPTDRVRVYRRELDLKRWDTPGEDQIVFSNIEADQWHATATHREYTWCTS